MTERKPRRILAFGSLMGAFARVVEALYQTDYDVIVVSGHGDPASVGQYQPDVIVLNGEWGSGVRSREVLRWLGIDAAISPIPIIACCSGPSFGWEPVGSLATRGIHVLVPPFANAALLEVVERCLEGGAGAGPEGRSLSRPRDPA